VVVIAILVVDGEQVQVLALELAGALGADPAVQGERTLAIALLSRARGLRRLADERVDVGRRSLARPSRRTEAARRRAGIIACGARVRTMSELAAACPLRRSTSRSCRCWARGIPPDVFRTVLVTSNAADMALARSILGAAGVEYVLHNEHALLVPLVRGVELLVDHDDLDAATALLRHAGLLG